MVLQFYDSILPDWVRAKEVSDAKTEDVPKVEQTEFPQRHEDSRKESEG